MSGIYETGKALIDIGVIPGSDITPGWQHFSLKYDVAPQYTETTVKATSCTSEAALTKLSYVLGKESWGLDERRWLLNVLIFRTQKESGEMLLIPRRAMNLSLRGEMTVQFEAINPRTQELNFNKVGIRRPD